MNFQISPDVCPSALEESLGRLLYPGEVTDKQIETCEARLHRASEVFLSCAPIPPWSPGLIIDREIRCQSEIYLPMKEIRSAFNGLLRRSLRYTPPLSSALLSTSLSWYDLLEKLPAEIADFSPSRIISRAATDYGFRQQLIASLFIPRHYGGSFGRYPEQSVFIARWLAEHKSREVTVLDAACGCGEMTLEIANRAFQAGIPGESLIVKGCTIDPLELVAASHGWFPNDQARGDAHRSMIKKVIAGYAPISFSYGNLLGDDFEAGSYDLVVCNGFIGGALLGDIVMVRKVVESLAKNVKKGGIVLVDDRFHDGWKRKIPRGDIENIFCQSGITAIPSPSGFYGIKL